MQIEADALVERLQSIIGRMAVENAALQLTISHLTDELQLVKQEALIYDEKLQEVLNGRH